MTRAILLGMVLGLGLFGCSLEKTPSSVDGFPAADESAPASSVAPDVPSEPEKQGDVYVVLPEKYSLHLNGAHELLFASSGLPEDLPVYASRVEAEQALRALESAAERSRHAWKAYRLDASWDKDVIMLESGEHRLQNPAAIIAVEE